MKTKRKIMIIAGEVSGDHHGAKLVEALREKVPAETDLEFFGATSHFLREAGVETIVNADEFAVMGLPEIIRRLPMFLKAYRKLRSEAVRRETDLAILVDFPDFNLKMARSLKKNGIKTVYYISPQLWAWKKYRTRIIRNYVDLMLTILPFEKDWFKKHRIDRVEYVGHPLAEEVNITLTKEEFCQSKGLDVAKPIVAFLPGSRSTEIARILPEMLETAVLMWKKNPDIQFVVALASTRKKTEVEKAFEKIEKKGVGLKGKIVTVKGQTREALNASDAAAVTSGTATLETTIIGTPFAIVYKTSRFNAMTIRPFVSVEHFGLVNLIAEKRVVTELIQENFTPETLGGELFRLLEAGENKKMRQTLGDITKKLGTGGTAKKAAGEILKMLNG